MDWVLKVKELLDGFSKTQKIILVGGTGFYLHTFLNGLSPIPFVSDETKERVTSLLKDLKDDFYNVVTKQDPSIKGIYHPNDTKRLSRAYAVFLETGRSITHFLNINPTFSFADSCYKIYLKPNRERLHKNIELRFYEMIKNGALEEVRDFINVQKKLDNLPVLNAVGAKQIIHYLEGKLSYDEMIIQCIQKTRQYAKRQYTWFNRQIKSDYLFEI